MFLLTSGSLSARPKAVFGSWASLNVAQYPGDIRGNPPLFSPLAQVQPAVKSLSFLYSLWIRMADYGYMCMIHEHTAVFSITDPAASHLFFLPPRGRVRSDEPVGEMRIASSQCYSELFLPPFFSANCTLRQIALKRWGGANGSHGTLGTKNGGQASRDEKSNFRLELS